MWKIHWDASNVYAGDSGHYKNILAKGEIDVNVTYEYSCMQILLYHIKSLQIFPPNNLVIWMQS